ncbi:MAG: hypothetical protein KIT69_02650 [Propionibacteriaceae bacterium]|nr:hypothetical protein [Propionibacteriaceae bacterium]
MKRVLTLIAGTILCLALLPPAMAHADPVEPPAGVTPGSQQFRSVTKPAISGTRKVGRVLTATVKSKPRASDWTYQWYRNGRPITAATAKQYRLTGDDHGKRIMVTATAWLAGYAATESKASARTAKIKRGTLTTRAPRIGGAAEIGGQLTAQVTGWSQGTGFSYQWYRNGKKISKATRATYVPTGADKGKRLNVKVTGRQAGYTPKSRTSKKTAKVKLATIPEAHRLRVGSFNVTVASATVNSRNPLARPWSERLPEVVRQIKAEGLHVVGVQEASAGTSATQSGDPQFRELAHALGDPWALTNDERYCDTEEDYARCPNGAGQNPRPLSHRPVGVATAGFPQARRQSLLRRRHGAVRHLGGIPRSRHRQAIPVLQHPPGTVGDRRQAGPRDAGGGDPPGDQGTEPRQPAGDPGR